MFFSLLLRCRRRGNGFKSTAAPTAAHFIHSVEKGIANYTIPPEEAPQEDEEGTGSNGQTV
jgi:hypothetical protein